MPQRSFESPAPDGHGVDDVVGVRYVGDGGGLARAMDGAVAPETSLAYRVEVPAEVELDLTHVAPTGGACDASQCAVAIRLRLGEVLLRLLLRVGG